ncbi:PilZ domain-containing protein [Nitrosococcus wardiae]|uniref:PilZ domain-containing protein n=1 Tax=Nitrosococcus wardiae TaxID=1814290 RepID=A0A4P7BVM9_9GAMM|nr:PilZ domain-containing protein [Nitrosococcus wardiae]QBQ53337.1 PilZ domain-containing protein [Nitrosococcus wardiae]
MVEKRKSERLPVAVEVQVEWAPSTAGPLIFKTRDLSDSGILLHIDGQAIPPVGQVVTIRLKDLLADGETPPLLKAEVVRQDNQSLGLKFLN